MDGKESSPGGHFNYKTHGERLDKNVMDLLKWNYEGWVSLTSH
jgi:hypothetical protein